MLFAVLSLFMACEPEPEEVGCDLMAIFSVNIELVDEEGSPITDAEISYTVDGEEGQTVENFEDGTYVVGVEEAGDFEISITAFVDPDDGCCVYDGSATISLTIEEDECHVIPQSIAPELEWVRTCDDSEECG